MDPLGSPIGNDGDKGKITRGRRCWTKVEEDALIQCLTDIVSDGWKAENGFKAGFQRELEKGVRKLLPGTDIVANPHINSKIHVWKKEYSALSDVLSKSGGPIGERDSFQDLVVLWQVVRGFGKDRATRENAVDPTDLVNEMLRTSAQEQEGDTAEKFMAVPSDKPNVMEDYSVCKPSVSGIKPISKGKKRKVVDQDMSFLVESLGMFMTQSDAKIGDIAREIGSGKEKPIDNNRLNKIMGRIVGLKMADKLKVCDELVQNTNRLDFFMSLTAEEQDEYVWMLLDGRL
ncbi:hypothetical protein ACS0TY_001119 [Phlomoides rotata]